MHVCRNWAENKQYLHYNEVFKANRVTGERSVSKTIVCKGLSILFKSHIVKVLAGGLTDGTDKIVSEILEEHFTFTVAEMAKKFQDSYSYALVAIGSDLATPENQRDFFETIFSSKRKKVFSAQLEHEYLVPFFIQQGFDDEKIADFRCQTVEHCQTLAPLQLFHGEEHVFSDDELVLFFNTNTVEALTRLLLDLVRQHHALSEEMVAYLQFKDLLGYSLLFFLYEHLYPDPRFQAIVSNLQQQGLMVDVGKIKTLVQSAQDTLEQAFAEQRYAEIGALGEELTQLQQVESITKEHYSKWIAFKSQFAHWSRLMSLGLEQILPALPHLLPQRSNIKDEGEQLSVILQQLMISSHLSSQIKPRDELTYYNTTNLRLIKQAVELSRNVALSSPQYSQIAIRLGSVVSSQGDLTQAEALFAKASQQANNDDERALSQFNLFQLFIRQQRYDKALTSLQHAIRLKPHTYALHNVHTYDLQCILGAGGMGCVFLAKNRFRNQQVVIKCFWEMVSGSSRELFKEVFLMAEIAGKYVPQPLHCGFVDEMRQQRGYFVAEYIPEAIDGEAWLEKHGALDVSTGIMVGLQIAKGLQLAHEKGIYHLDLKPANILLRHLDNKAIQVKIIDFGLANIAPSLGQEMAQRSRHSLSVFAQTAMFGTLDYASPEQQGMTRYGVPDAKSDVYSFGKTLYRLLTAENPQTFHPRRLKEEFKLFDLLCDCVELDPEQRPVMADVIQRLTEFLIPETLVKEKKQIVSPSPNLAPKPKPKVAFIESEMVQMPSGSFIMGCIETKTKRGIFGIKTIEKGRDDVEGGCRESEQPAHKVALQAFMLGRYPVTFREFDSFCDATGFKEPNDEGWGRGRRPVINVSWYDAQEYIAWLCEVSGKHYRLPSEAEWEYAARANTDTAYPWGNTASHDYANYGNKMGKTTSVGSYPANNFGLYDMHGNIWEWVADVGHDNYHGAPTDGSVWEEGGGSNRVVRGGSWIYDSGSIRSAYRYQFSPNVCPYYSGFRLCLDL